MANPMASLAALLKMRSPANIGAAPGQRGLDIATGMDAFEPTEGELIAEQAANPMVSGEPRTGQFLNFRSRDSIRDDAMASTKRALGMADIAHRQKVEQVERPVRLKGEYDLAAADRNIQAEQIARTAQQDAIRERQEEGRAFTASQNDLNRAQQTMLQNDRQANTSAVRVPTQGVLSELQKARQAMPQNPLTRMLSGGAANERLRGALGNVLEQKGLLQRATAMVQDARAEGLSADDFAGQAAQNGITLDPAEVEFIRISLGR